MLERREGERERGALARLALGPDPPAVLLDEAAADGEAEAGAALLARVGGVDLLEALEDRLQLIGRDAATFVGDAEQDVAVVLGRRERHDPADRART